GAIELPLPPQPMPSSLLSRRAPFPAGERPFPRASALSRGRDALPRRSVLSAGQACLPSGKATRPTASVLRCFCGWGRSDRERAFPPPSALSRRRAPFPAAERAPPILWRLRRGQERFPVAIGRSHGQAFSPAA